MNHENMMNEPVDHVIGRSRGGSTCEIHRLVDGTGLPLVVLVGPGQGDDAPTFPVLMDHLRRPRTGPGRPRTRPDTAPGDEAHASRAIRTHLHNRGIGADIPEPDDQEGHRRRRGSGGGRPPALDADRYRGRHVVERALDEDEQWRALATQNDELAVWGYLPLEGNHPAAAVLRAITP